MKQPDRLKDANLGMTKDHSLCILDWPIQTAAGIPPEVLDSTEFTPQELAQYLRAVKRASARAAQFTGSLFD